MLGAGDCTDPASPPGLQAQHGLTDEVHQLEATIAALKHKLAQAQ